MSNILGLKNHTKSGLKENVLRIGNPGKWAVRAKLDNPPFQSPLWETKHHLSMVTNFSKYCITMEDAVSSSMLPKG